ncbi:unnamed protein product, partial [Schistosoma mattheei]
GALISKRKNSGHRRCPVLEADSLFDNFDSDQSDLKPPSKKMTATKENQDENSTYRMYSQKNTTALNKIPLSTSKFTKQFPSILNGCNLTKEVKQRYGSRLTDHPDSNIRSTQKRDSLDIDELIQPLVPPSNQFIPSNGNPSSITSAASFYKSKARYFPGHVNSKSKRPQCTLLTLDKLVQHPTDSHKENHPSVQTYVDYPAHAYINNTRDTPKSVGNLSNSTNVSNALTMMQNKIHHLSDTVLFPWSITNNSTQIDPKSLSKSACKTLRDTKKGNLAKIPDSVIDNSQGQNVCHFRSQIEVSGVGFLSGNGIGYFRPSARAPGPFHSNPSSRTDWAAKNVVYELVGLVLLEDEEEQDSTYDRGKKRMFSREIRSMLYAFGDDENPLPETVSLVEDIAVRHIIEMECGSSLAILPFMFASDLLLSSMMLPRYVKDCKSPRVASSSVIGLVLSVLYLRVLHFPSCMLRPPDADAAAILFVVICISSCVLDRRARSSAKFKSSNWFRAVHRIPCFPSDVEVFII